MPGRDCKGQIPADIKTDYLKALINAGFKHIDAVSFVSPKAVPQMADSEEVLKELDPPDDVEIIGIVVNEKGAERAIETQAVRTLGFPYSVSPTFLQNNQRQTLEDAIDELEKIKHKAEDGGLDRRRLYFDGVRQSVRRSVECRTKWSMRSSCSSPKALRRSRWRTRWAWRGRSRFASCVDAVLGEFDYLEIGVHLHSRPEHAVEKIVGRV